MSLKYRDNNGNETPVAGLNGVSGELIPSTTLLQTGSVSGASAQNTTLAPGTFTVMTITLPTSMPDNNYIVKAGTDSAYVVAIESPNARATNSFRLYITNQSLTETIDLSEVTFTWQAFKLVTDESRALDEAAITALQEVVPSNATSSNKLVPASDTFVSYIPSTDDYSTWAELLEMIHQKGTGLWCGRAYLDNQWWQYTVSIQVGVNGYWLGGGTFKSSEGINLKGVNKTYSTSSTWSIVSYVPDTALTSSVTSGSTAPVTSGGVFSGTALAFRGKINDGYVTVMGQGLYLVTVDKHGTSAGLGTWIVAVYSTSSIEATSLSSTFGNITFSWNSTTKRITASGETNISVNAVYIGAYY